MVHIDRRRFGKDPPTKRRRKKEMRKEERLEERTEKDQQEKREWGKKKERTKLNKTKALNSVKSQVYLV